MEGVYDDQPHPQAVVLSQTCWEYKELLHQENRTSHEHTRSVEVAVPLQGPSSRIWSDDTAVADRCQDSRTDTRHPKRAKTSVPVSAQQLKPTHVEAGIPPTTQIQALHLACETQDHAKHILWDIFVLVLQTSGLQQITSKAGVDMDFGTLLVADPSSSFFRVTLWRRAARFGARLIRAGDLVRLNRYARGWMESEMRKDPLQLQSVTAVRIPFSPGVLAFFC